MSESVSVAVSQEIVEKMPHGVVVVDSEGRLLSVNQAVLEMLGSSALDLSGLSQDQQTQLEQWLTQSVVKGHDGNLLSKVCIELEGGAYAYLFGIQQEIESTNDPLTGLASQRTMIIALQTLLSVARRYEKPLSALLVRINNLDQLPHEQALMALSQCLKAELRWSDLVGRNSEDSFIVALPETDQQACDVLHEKLQRVLQGIMLEGVSEQPEYNLVVLESNKHDDVSCFMERLGA